MTKKKKKKRVGGGTQTKKPMHCMHKDSAYEAEKHSENSVEEPGDYSMAVSL